MPATELNSGVQRPQQILDFTIVRAPYHTEIDVYYKPATTDTPIHFLSDHLNEKKHGDIQIQ